MWHTSNIFRHAYITKLKLFAKLLKILLKTHFLLQSLNKSFENKTLFSQYRNFPRTKYIYLKCNYNIHLTILNHSYFNNFWFFSYSMMMRDLGICTGDFFLHYYVNSALSIFHSELKPFFLPPLEGTAL